GHPWVTRRTTNEQMSADIIPADILAGTAWLFSRPEFDQQLDFLVVDEAGQLSLANVVAVGTSARNLLLVGDPRQLAQPSLGTHPPGADSSALGHVLGDAETIPADRGIFLDTTHRLHPSITRFISEIVYDGRLESEPGCERRAVSGGGPLSGSGLRFVPVEHRGNRTSSLEEVAVVKRCVEQLVGRTWTERGGAPRPLDLDDILVVAPYNAQVNLLRSALPPGVRVGTVDRFQGQEAPVVIISLAASSAEDVPRGMEFLYSLNRLNVAVSRAMGLAVLVCAPALLAAPCNSVEQLRLVNALCRYVELAETVEVR
ncbi:MAG: family RecB-like putative nuclease, partial [Acidimicrobiaceae bacterium]|nr:family RecB-like putative nuclease [Acidimicrobiaceae bacterium]